jgi:acyl-CoA reductase-like NAD-dependent aldehyde dehydrogenase
MKAYDKLFINGDWVTPSGKGSIDVINSTTEEVMGRIPEGNAEDIDRAVRAAKTAFESWSQLAPAKRAEYLNKIAAGLTARADELAKLVAEEVGMPLMLSKMIQAGLPTANFGLYAKLGAEYAYEEKVGHSLVVREPVGVVGCITPWNYPLHQIAAKVAPALAVGCTVVLKPSEVAPLNAFLLAEVAQEAGLPPGVLNIVTGFGPVVGEALASHPDVDMISLTGSTGAGRRVSELGAKTIKRVHLELGGKSAAVVLDDADFAKAVAAEVTNCYLNSGQTCSAHTRLLVPRAKKDEAIAVAKKTAESFTYGDPVNDKVRMGPLVSAVQRDRVRNYIKKGIEEGATLVTGGAEQPESTPKGFFVKPTVFADVTPTMTIAKEEIFGPVLSIIAYEDEADAIRIANDTVYGLAGAVWSGDPERAQRVARKLRTGQVDINGGGFNLMAPFGGYKQSGNGRELGKFGLDEFLEFKSLQLTT